ncbi:MAG: phosphoribosylaminoimidazolesuccinocarboxamide synthase [Proteobacteria bacterium]|nr:phosphoribosylaminoimidazolesuccinocarboxamide synthase [Pseudomonadota bacterium]
MKINLPQIHQGKVRDVYQIDDQHLLMVASDRLSAFDVVLPDQIPQKGALLTQISNFWFKFTTPIISNHLSNIPVQDVISGADSDLISRSVVVKKLKALPVEAIVRSYIIGSGWKDYQQTGSVCGIRLPENLKQAEKLPENLFTPSSKAAVGDHDINISVKKMENIIGAELSQKIIKVSLQIFSKASKHAEAQGIIIADTKYEFGLDVDGQVVLMDELLTPDSARFWDKASYQTGISPNSYDKQLIRDYLETLDWNKTSPGPKIPEKIILQTAGKYHEVYRKITGKKFKLNQRFI